MEEKYVGKKSIITKERKHHTKPIYLYRLQCYVVGFFFRRFALFMHIPLIKISNDYEYH